MSVFPELTPNQNSRLRLPDQGGDLLGIIEVGAFQELAHERPGTNGFRGGLIRVFASVKRWHGRRQTRARLSRLSERQLRDVGLEPSDVYGALNGQHPSLWENPHSRPDIR